jgi:hypothetical protein
MTSDRQIKRDTRKVVRKLLKFVDKHDTIGRPEVEAINLRVMEYVHQNTGIGMGQVVEKMGKVLRDLPHEYGQLDEESRSWDAFIAYLYLKYLKELGLL